MTSAINAAYPEYGAPTTASVRANFAAAKSEIEALQTQATGVVNVLSYGAVRDGVTDDTDAVQAAATAAAGKALYFPAGTYLIDDAILLASNTTYFGDGPQSIIKATTLADQGAGIGHVLMYGDTKTNVVIRDLAFDDSGLTVWARGARSIQMSACSDYTITDCTFTCNGGAVASVGSSNFMIANNRIAADATDSATHSDGIIDQWGGSHDFNVIDNHIDGGGIAKYPILVTGEDTAGSAAACYNFTIANNDINDVLTNGIWLNGREGTVYRFHVVGNKIRAVAGFHGILLQDCREGVVSGNLIEDATRNGINLSEETAQGGTLSAVNVQVTNNVIKDVSATGIILLNSCSGCVIRGNRIIGSTHTYGVLLDTGTTGNWVGDNLIDKGSEIKVNNASVTNRMADSGKYIPTLTSVANVAASTAYNSQFTVEGDVVTVRLRLSVTPTAASGTATTIGISLPIASDLGSIQTDCFGVMSTEASLSGAIVADATNDRAQFQFAATNTSANIFYGTFSYVLL